MVYFGLCLFVVLEYARPAAYISALLPLHLNSIIPTLVAVKAMTADGHPTMEEVLSETTTRLLLFFLGLLAISVVTSDVQQYSWEMFTAVVGYILIYFGLTRQLTTMDQIKGIFRMLVIVHLIVCALNPQIFTSPDRQYLQGAPFLGDGNDFALSVNVVIPLTLFLLFEARGFLARAFYGGSLLVFLLGIVATQSRGGTLALGAVAIYYWTKNDRKVVTAAIAAVAVAIVLAVAPPQYFARMSDVANTEEGSAQGRIEAWKGSMRMALSNPLLGVGSGHFGVTYGARFKRPPQTAHSIYFLLLGELGLPGLIFLISFIATNLVQNRRTSRVVRDRASPDSRRLSQMLAATSASLLAYAVAGAFLSAAYYPHMYLLAGLLVASRRLALTTEASATTPSPAKAGISYHWALRQTLGGASPSRTLQRG